MLLAEQGKPVAGMFHHQRNPLVDYLWNSARLHFGGRIHARESGIKPLSVQYAKDSGVTTYLMKIMVLSKVNLLISSRPIRRHYRQ